MKIIFLRIFLILSFLSVFSSSIYAQTGATTGSFLIKIKDMQQISIQGATVTVKQLETGFEKTAQSDASGQIEFLQLPPGPYTIVAEAENFTSKDYKLFLNVGINGLITFQLAPSGTVETIDVIADMSMFRTESSTNTTRERIEELPINRRGFFTFAITAPRVVPDRLPGFGTAATSGLSFNGLPGRVNNIKTDGLDNIERGSGSVNTVFSQNSVDEFQVVSDGYSAEFGRSIGGIINIVTKKGGNDLHSSLFFLNRNDKTSSRDAFATFKPPFSQNQFGLTLSGPIKRDKHFFFSSFERLTVKQNSIVTILDSTIAAANRRGFNEANGPAPTSLGTTFFLFRSDFNLSSRDTLTVRYDGNFSFNSAFDPIGGLTAASNSTIQDLSDNGLIINNVYTGNTFINETRFRLGRRDQKLFSNNPGPQVQLLNPEGRVLLGLFDNGVQNRFGFGYNIVNNTTLVKGPNQIKFGIDFQHINGDKDRTVIGIFPRGFQIFAPLDFSAMSPIPVMFSALEAFDPSLRSPLQRSFLRAVSVIFPTVIPNFPTGVPLDRLPIPAAYVQGFGDPRLGENIRSNYFSAFVQNDLKAKENLLVKFGVRYDLDRINLTPNNSGNFSPRIAVAYSPKNLQNLRFKAGYGLFFGFLTFGTSAVARQQEVGRLQLLTLPFPFSTLPGLSPGGTLPQSTTLPQGPGLDFVPQFSAVERVDPNLRSSYSQQANLGIDYILNKKTEISLAYNFVRGIKLVSRRNINPIVRPVPNNPLLSMLTGRVDPTQGVINQTESASDSYYNALTATVLYRFSPGFDILGTYTYSKAIDNVLQVFPTEVRLIDVAANSLNIRNERGLSIQDLRHRFILSGNVSLSYSKNPLLRDYQLSFIVSANGSRPYNLITSTDLNMDGSDGDRPNVGRNTGITPGFAAFDVRFQRVVKFSEIYKLNLIFEVFNLFNKTNIDPNAIDRNFLPDMQGNFQLPTQENGRFTLPRERFRGAFLPRQIQLGLRFSF